MSLAGNAFQKPDGCEEAVFVLPGQTKPFACNQPATKYVGWPLRKEGPYRMCEEHAYHSVKNRNAADLGDYHTEEGCCTGCGSNVPLAILQANGNLSCCPERNIQPCSSGSES